MRKYGFTLVELLVVIAIIAVLSIIIVPSVINVNNNVNNRLYDSKKESITTAATLYASRNDDIFNGVDEVTVYVSDIIDMGYLEIDVDLTDARCTTVTSNGAKGCILNPKTSGTLNKDYVILRKQGAAGYYAEYHPSDDENGGSGSVTTRTLVTAVCEAFNSDSNPLTGKSSKNGSVKTCKCYNIDADAEYDQLKDESGDVVDACIVSGENPNNYLRYGDSKPNWRVLGVYNIGGELYAKIITSEPI